MSKTRPVTYGHHGFWAYDVGLGVFLKYLIDVVEASGQANTPFLAKAIESWRLAPIIDTTLCFEESWSALQRQNVINFIEEACARLATRKAISAEEIATWPNFGSHRLFLRGAKAISTTPVIELGKAIIAMLRDELPEAPKSEAWYYGTENGRSTIKMDTSWDGRW